MNGTISCIELDITDGRGCQVDIIEVGLILLKYFDQHTAPKIREWVRDKKHLTLDKANEYLEARRGTRSTNHACTPRTSTLTFNTGTPTLAYASRTPLNLPD
ncbi:Hypothetical predicted protein [Pelobates cultripes]|uniref:Uncharacterized protein n=1 Tax=Pelobates cultripes TaxID=61616 RepID=A0AAD1WCX7_PELCU|nr:Hypothetical predicted protein [Pelobates cultripes]